MACFSSRVSIVLDAVIAHLPWVRIVGLTAAALNIWGFIETNENKTKGIFAASSLVWGLQYLLLNSTAGASIMFLAAVRQWVSVYARQMSRQAKWNWVIGFSVTALVLTLEMGKVWYLAMVPLSATLIGTWSFFFANNFMIRKLTLLTNSLWAVHALVFESWELLVCMIFLNLANLYGLWRLQLQTRVPEAPLLKA